MKPVETYEEQQAKAARDALEQAFEYYSPEAPVAGVLEPEQEQLFEYYQAA
ncbi:hypothetical protein K3725_04505 [Leisingera sp. S132]|uniref:hypothetical protein n=1 Tax=Leisingera sp. S132 TaxID=2867016 RepID=UPI0021A90FA2|nr:hypothetical protein [Leisingera sp. S132]UWQ80281.1 hypothetical protein K3725_04505 [Leisingera sp. S132]